jgi:Trehalose receptor
LATAISDNHLQLTYCKARSSIFWDNFLARYRPHLRYQFKYNAFQLPLYEVSLPVMFNWLIKLFVFMSFQWVNLLQQFSWNYGDIFVMLLAIGISFRFKQFNDYFQHVLKNENLMTKSTWRDMRVHYFQLVDLVYFIDARISTLILLSLGHNMLVLVLKIFNAFK